MCYYLLFQMLKEVSISKPESVQCDVCVFVVKLIDQYVEQNKTKVGLCHLHKTPRFHVETDPHWGAICGGLQAIWGSSAELLTVI